MRCFLSIVILIVLISGCMDTPTGVAPSNPMVMDFVTVWEAFEANYPEFTVKNVNWMLMYGKYLPLAEKAETADELMMDVVLPMIGELYDVHMWLQTPAKEIIYTYSPEYHENYDLNMMKATYLNPAGFTGYSQAVGYCNPDSLPYLTIRAWYSTVNVERIDEFVALCSDIPAIIIDVRMNGGGSTMRLQEAAGRFVHESGTAWTMRFRTGPDYDDCEYENFTNEVMGPLQYNGTIYLLIGENCASTCEGFILGMDELPNVVLLGDTTMGALTCPYWTELSNGWSFTAGAWAGRTANYQPAEGIGIAPHLYIEATEEHFAQGFDPILDYAIQKVDSINGL